MSKKTSKERLINSPNERLISIQDAARRLGLSKHVIYLWIKKGKFPYVQAGARRLIDCRDLETFISDNRVEATELLPGKDST